MLPLLFWKYTFWANYIIISLFICLIKIWLCANLPLIAKIPKQYKNTECVKITWHNNTRSPQNKINLIAILNLEWQGYSGFWGIFTWKGITSWLSCVWSFVVFCHFPEVSWVGDCTWLYWLLIFASLITLTRLKYLQDTKNCWSLLSGSEM